ncbi:Transcriptional regulator, AraC family [Granulibacter bethesdensis]|uniref:Transcriptional regulator, AraC family n=1 Tax=Granulibacter bethesdensis TaxID=364410 RepID=A0AAC9P9D5_9PROT|nr:GyrI-like domain-containing protein [Granulibacter bethesdensis]APH55491.1 Transcriptional regulator, AraC family [Granulibacter bethesdensis]APH63077.1 Transcriptional regulator, AraC family [Granulibacter bethesdensis]
MKVPLQHYHTRMQRVLDYIDHHLDDELSVERLSNVAAFSKYHFHRQFTALFGLSVHDYIQLTRLKRASFRLAYRNAERITNIALDAGYDAPDAFARAFRKQFRQSPSAFRAYPDWQQLLETFEPLDQARSRRIQPRFTTADITIRETDPIPVAIMTHRGDPAMIGATIQRFIAWRKTTGLTPRISPTFNIFHSDPHTTSPEEYRLDLCVGTARRREANGEKLEQGIIPGGRCAVLRATGHSDNLEQAAAYLYRV